MHLYDTAKDDVLAVKVGRWYSRDEKLAAVGVGTSIRHAEQPCADVLVLEILVSKLGAVDALAASSVVVGEVATLSARVGCSAAAPKQNNSHLQHETGDNAVEDAAAKCHMYITNDDTQPHLPL
jgi:hypothetical protein